MGSPATPTETGIRLAVRLKPRASKDGCDGVAADAAGRPVLQMRIAAPPVEGAANVALTAWLAKALGVRKTDVRIASGEHARQKMLEIAGDPAVLMARVAAFSPAT